MYFLIFSDKTRRYQTFKSKNDDPFSHCSLLNQFSPTCDTNSPKCV